MPVKVRCKNCRKVLNAPDKARGKVIKCPGCEGKVRVPLGKSGATGKKKKKVVKKADDDFLSGLDLDDLEDTSVRVCPRCGTEAEEEDVDCKNCHVNLETGVISVQTRKKLRRKGPDPAEFYGKVWHDSWDFLMKNKILAVKSALLWALFSVLAVCCLLMAIWVDHLPPRFFWASLTTIFAFGAPGWYWFLNGEIIKVTMDGKDKLKKAEFDFFSTIALGLKAVVWPYVVLLPFTVVFIFLGIFTFGYHLDSSSVKMIAEIASGSSSSDDSKQKGEQAEEEDGTEEEAEIEYIISPTWAFFPLQFVIPIAYLLTRMMFPIAHVHMTMRYTYKAWLPVDMVVIFFKNIGPALYWCVVWVAVNLPMLITVGVLLLVYGFGIIDSIQGGFVWILTKVMELTGVGSVDMLTDPDERSFMFYLLFPGMVILCLTIVVTTLAFTMAFPAVFMMRANGLFGYYFKRNLDLMTSSIANKPAGFWPRYLAFLVDWLVLFLADLLLRFALLLGLFVLARLGANAGMLAPLFMLYLLVAVGLPIAYYVKQESGSSQATLGKYAIGLVVTDLEGEPISPMVAFYRFLARNVSGILGIGFVMAAFTENKQTLHDSMTKTQVVWRGEEAEY